MAATPLRQQQRPSTPALAARRSLWRAEEQQPEVCSTRGVALYARPSAQDVAAQALSGI